MPYGDAGSYLPALSRLIGEVESPTQNQGMMNPQFGGSPEQLRQMMMAPHMQGQLRQWGLGGWDPNQIRQSPFFNNQMMQQHPLLGGMLNQGLANVAQTPEAPLVSGAGSGFSRAAQGMAGGPEMLRQFQVRQMLAPFQMMGAQMPMQEFQRKQQLLGLLQQMEQGREQQGRESLKEREYEAQGRLAKETEPKVQPVPGGYTTSTYQKPQPAGGESGADLQPTGPSNRQLGSLTGGQPTPQPGWAMAPPTQGGWDTKFTGTDPETLKLLHPHNPPAAPKQPGQWTPKGAAELESKKSAGQQALLKEYAPIREKYKNDQEWQKKDPKTFNNFMSRMQQLEDDYTSAGRASGGTYPGYEYPGMHSSVGHQNQFMAPNTQAQGGGGAPQQQNLQLDEAGNIWDMSNPNQPQYVGKQGKQP